MKKILIICLSLLHFADYIYASDIERLSKEFYKTVHGEKKASPEVIQQTQKFINSILPYLNTTSPQTQKITPDAYINLYIELEKIKDSLKNKELIDQFANLLDEKIDDIKELINKQNNNLTTQNMKIYGLESKGSTANQINEKITKINQIINNAKSILEVMKGFYNEIKNNDLALKRKIQEIRKDLDLTPESRKEKQKEENEYSQMRAYLAAVANQPECCNQKADNEPCSQSDECRGSCKCKISNPLGKTCLSKSGNVCQNEDKYCMNHGKKAECENIKKPPFYNEFLKKHNINPSSIKYGKLTYI